MARLMGLETVLKNLEKELEKKRLYTKEGLTESALVIKADSVRNTPIDIGNLRGSCFIRVTDSEVDNLSPNFGGKKSDRANEDHRQAIAESKALVEPGKYRYNAIVAYSAYYAIFVHEMPSTNNFNSGSNQFLLKAVLKNQKRVLKILQKWASR